jgi:23S rRNA (guanosine2251-2'-O)-methyltransferase
MKKPANKPTSKSQTYWMYGRHAVRAACENPQRQVRRVILAGKQAPDWLKRDVSVQLQADNALLEKLVGREAVHQGIVAEVVTLAPPHLDEITPHHPPLLLLDQVTDPHNVGAILRSAAAFGVGAILMPKDGAAPESAVMAKAACGALEHVPLIPVTNLVQAMTQLKEAGYWLAGLDGAASQDLDGLAGLQPLGLVLGAEGAGLRRLTAQHCDRLVKIPMQPVMESLNVSNAAAIALYAMQM